MRLTDVFVLEIALFNALFNNNHTFFFQQETLTTAINHSTSKLCVYLPLKTKSVSLQFV